MFKEQYSVVVAKRLLLQLFVSVCFMIPVVVLGNIIWPDIPFEHYLPLSAVIILNPRVFFNAHNRFLGHVEVTNTGLVIGFSQDNKLLVLHWGDIVDVTYKKYWPYLFPLWSVRLICDRRNLKEMYKLLPNKRMEIPFPWPLADEQGFKRRILEVAPEYHPMREFVERVIK